MIKVPKLLYKYRYWGDSNHQRMITHNEIFFASPRCFNDPFDCRIMTSVEGSKEQMQHYFDRLVRENSPELSKEQRKKEVRKRIREHIKTRNDPDKREKYDEFIRELTFDYFGVFSMSASNENILLWSHYSDSHKGFCIGIDPMMLSKHVIKNQFLVNQKTSASLFQVKYQEDYPDLSLLKNPSPDINMMNDSLTIKSIDWEYEQEYRLILMHGANYLFKLPEETIVSVHLGLSISKEHREQILEELRKRKTKTLVYEAKRKRKAFGLEFSEVSY